MYDDMYGSFPNRNSMTAAAVVFGLISIFSCAVIYIALPAGALAFLFALLSRTEQKMSGKGKAGIICGLLGMILTVAITVFSFYFVFTNDTARNYMNQYFRYYTGDMNADFEEEMNKLFSSFGFSSDLFSSDDTADISPEDSQSQDSDSQFMPDDADLDTDSDTNKSFAPDDLSQEEGVFL